MRREEIILESTRKVKLPGVLWIPENEPKAILQITHGMTEHIGRYEKLAEELTEQGIIVAGFDLRGHGKNMLETDYASFGKNGWEGSLQDMHFFYQMLEERFPQLPHYMLGFSLGSFLLREYLNKYREQVAGAAILGSGYCSWLILTVMRLIVRTQIKKVGFDDTTPLVQKLSFDVYNKKFAPARTRSDWLCADMKQLTDYLLDPYCREDISAGLFWQLLGSMRKTGRKKAYEHWKKDMPVLLLSGDMDAVGNFGKGVKTLQKKMKKAGLRNVQMHLYSGARHDILHEEENAVAEKVRKRLGEWILNDLIK